MNTLRSVLVVLAQAALFVVFGSHAGDFGGRALDRWALALNQPTGTDPLPFGHHRRAS